MALPPSCSDSSWTDAAHLGTSLPSRALSFWEHGLRLPAHTHLSQLAELTRGLHCFKRIFMLPCPLQLLTAFSVFRRQLLHGHTQGTRRCRLWALVPTQPGTWVLRLSRCLVTCCTEWNHSIWLPFWEFPSQKGPLQPPRYSSIWPRHLLCISYVPGTEGPPKQGG